MTANDQLFGEIEQDLRQFGEQVSKNILKLHAEAEKNPPRLESIDEWGNVSA